MVSIIPGIETRAPLRTETSNGIVGAAEALAGPSLELGHRGADLAGEPIGQTATGFVISEAGFGGDRKPGRDGEPGAGHLGEAGAFAAEEVFHLPRAVFEEPDALGAG